MKPYDFSRNHLGSYFGGKYPYVMVVQGHIPVAWMNENLERSFTSWTEDCMGQEYSRQIIGYGISSVPGRDDENFYLFHDKNNFDLVVAAFSEQIITTDPFGPDLCPACGGPSPETTVVEKEVWKHNPVLVAIVFAIGVLLLASQFLSIIT